MIKSRLPNEVIHHIGSYTIKQNILKSMELGYFVSGIMLSITVFTYDNIGIYIYKPKEIYIRTPIMEYNSAIGSLVNINKYIGLSDKPKIIRTHFPMLMKCREDVDNYLKLFRGEGHQLLQKYSYLPKTNTLHISNMKILMRLDQVSEIIKRLKNLDAGLCLAINALEN